MFRHIGVMLPTILGLYSCALSQTCPPFSSSSIKPPSSYKGPLFQLSYNYPQEPVNPPANPPWIAALKGKPISADNAIAYVQAVKDYLTADMRTLILDYKNWNATKAGWYNLPWLCSIQDPVHGTYLGLQYDTADFPLSNLKQPMDTYVLVYYNKVAGYTLSQLWGKDAMNPDVTKGQFREGAIIIKAAFTTATPETWSPLDGAALWDVYANNPQQTPHWVKLRLFQFDIIVKDSKTAPDTSWVFATLVYDKNVQGDAWDRMIPLGAMWGNDPDINSAVDPNAILQQNVVNNMAPLYAVETLGYGGRLSGPNDGSVQRGILVDGTLVPRARVSSCMSCHGVAQWPLKSFLLPGPAIKAGGNLRPQVQGSAEYIYKPGTLEFNRWFQSRPGNVAQDSGTVALDYDMNIAFKALPFWYTATHAKTDPDDRIRKETPPSLRRLLLEPESTAKDGSRIVVRKQEPGSNQ